MDRLFTLKWWQIGRFGEEDAKERVLAADKMEEKEGAREGRMRLREFEVGTKSKELSGGCTEVHSGVIPIYFPINHVQRQQQFGFNLPFSFQCIVICNSCCRKDPPSLAWSNTLQFLQCMCIGGM
jgi:hypothetical protein